MFYNRLRQIKKGNKHVCAVFFHCKKEQKYNFVGKLLLKKYNKHARKYGNKLNMQTHKSVI